MVLKLGNRRLLECMAHPTAGIFPIRCIGLSFTFMPADSEQVEQRLVALEIKASFTEDLVEQLNEVIVRQQQQLDLLINELRQLRQQVPTQSGNGEFRSLRDDLPPHY